jgi:NAD(P)-dependent dehydrogenase (short-subunit alcohol dehydrogenase family)
MMLHGKSALVTGAARGIGRAIAERYVREGAGVMVGDLDAKAGEAAARSMSEGARSLHLDVTRRDSIDVAIAGTAAAFGRLDILVNNAGIFDLAPIVEITRESYVGVYVVDVEGLLFTP